MAGDVRPWGGLGSGTRPMCQVTLRLPVTVHDRLRRSCAEAGVGVGALFDAAAFLFFRTENVDPRLIDEGWAAGRAMAKAIEFNTEPRRKVVFRMDAGLAEQCLRECNQQGLSRNVAFTMIFMMPPDISPELAAYVRERRAQGIALARSIDRHRRSTTV